MARYETKYRVTAENVRPRLRDDEGDEFLREWNAALADDEQGLP
jgi:hypothetical protein